MNTLHSCLAYYLLAVNAVIHRVRHPRHTADTDCVDGLFAHESLKTNSLKEILL